MRVLTWDIGGANVKRLLLDSKGSLRSDIYYFPLWKKKERLPGFLREKKLGCDLVGVTMTAELCDIFRSKKEGVEFVVDACEEVFEKPFYLTVDGELLRAGEIRNPLILAASNWVASLCYLERRFRSGVLLDVGSTTTDIIPFGGGERAMTDLERLQRGQLVYTGFLRTPVSAIAARVPFKGRLTRISSEAFAISADVYNVLGMLPRYGCETPDGRGKSPLDSMRRVARMLCADLDEVGEEEVRRICGYLFEKQAASIAGALSEVLEELEKPRVFGCGVGLALAARACELIRVPMHSLAGVTPAHDNLPCLGLAEMLIGKI
jgi:hypothetical protein